MQVVSLLTNILSRHYEFQADDFAVGLGHAQPLGAALKVLDKKNRSASNVDPWCAFTPCCTGAVQDTSSPVGSRLCVLGPGNPVVLHTLLLCKRCDPCRLATMCQGTARQLRHCAAFMHVPIIIRPKRAVVLQVLGTASQPPAPGAATGGDQRSLQEGGIGSLCETCMQLMTISCSSVLSVSRLSAAEH